MKIYETERLKISVNVISKPWSLSYLNLSCLMTLWKVERDIAGKSPASSLSTHSLMDLSAGKPGFSRGWPSASVDPALYSRTLRKNPWIYRMSIVLNSTVDLLTPSHNFIPETRNHFFRLWRHMVWRDGSEWKKATTCLLTDLRIAFRRSSPSLSYMFLLRRSFLALFVKPPILE